MCVIICWKRTNVSGYGNLHWLLSALTAKLLFVGNTYRHQLNGKNISRKLEKKTKGMLNRRDDLLESRSLLSVVRAHSHTTHQMTRTPTYISHPEVMLLTRLSCPCKIHPERRISNVIGDSLFLEQYVLWRETSSAFQSSQDLSKQ